MISVSEASPLNEVQVNRVVVDIGAIKTKRLSNINDLREASLLDRSIPELLIDY